MQTTDWNKKRAPIDICTSTKISLLSSCSLFECHDVGGHLTRHGVDSRLIAIWYCGRRPSVQNAVLGCFCHHIPVYFPIEGLALNPCPTMGEEVGHSVVERKQVSPWYVEHLKRDVLFSQCNILFITWKYFSFKCEIKKHTRGALMTGPCVCWILLRFLSLWLSFPLKKVCFAQSLSTVQ